MAETLNGDKRPDDTGRGTTAGHNSAAINETMRQKFEDLYELECQIEQAKQTHVKPLQDQKNELKKELREATGAKQADLKPWWEVFKRKKDAERMEEGGDEALDMLRQGYEALSEGGQLDYILALDDEPASGLGQNTQDVSAPAQGRA